MVRFDHGFVKRVWVSSDGRKWRRLTWRENLRFVLKGVLPDGN